MPHLVTASIQPSSRLRREQVPPKRVEVIPSGFSDGKGTTFFFTEDGTNETDLQITDTRTFNLDVPVDFHNWNTLKLYLMCNPSEKKRIALIDAEEESNKFLEQSEKAFKVEAYIRQHEQDHTLLAKLYRRAVGLVDGVTESTIFKTLLDLSRRDPDKFLSGKTFIDQNEDFEMLALVDICVERAYLKKDLDGTIKLSDGKIYAESVQKAAFLLKTDDGTRISLQRRVEGLRENVSTAYEPIIEDSEYVKLASSFGRKAESKIKELTIAPDSEADIQEKFAVFLDAGLIEKKGAGPSTRYFITDLPDNEFTKKELLEFFKLNTKQYEHLKKQAAA